MTARARPERRWARVATVAALAALAVACGRAPQDTGLDQATFVATYVDLRKAGLEQGGGPLDDHVRDSILAVHGVTQEELLGFTDAHGDDPEFMKGVWDAVELRLDSVMPPATPDTLPRG